MDLKGSVSYSRTDGVYNVIKKYVDATVNFDRSNRNSVRLTAADVQTREVHIGIPKGAATRQQISEMQRAVSYGRSRGVSVKFYEVKK